MMTKSGAVAGSASRKFHHLQRSGDEFLHRHIEVPSSSLPRLRKMGGYNAVDVSETSSDRLRTSRQASQVASRYSSVPDPAGSKNRRPPFRRNAIALPPLADGRGARADV